MDVKKRNKIFALIFIFIVSIYAATMVHEIGHAITFLYYGCGLPYPVVSPFITGHTGCLFPEGWWDGVGFFGDFITSFSGILFVSLMGILFLLIYRKSSYVKNHYILSFLFYFFSFNFLLNGFLQSLIGGDLNYLLDLGISNIYFLIFSAIIGLLLLFHVLGFKGLIMDSGLDSKKKNIKRWRIGFLVLFLLICVVYLGAPYLFYLF